MTLWLSLTLMDGSSWPDLFSSAPSPGLRLSLLRIVQADAKKGQHTHTYIKPLDFFFFFFFSLATSK